MKKNLNMYGYYFYRLTMALVSIDLWILLKARRFTRFITKLLGSMLHVVFLMALGAGVLLAYIATRDKSYSPIYEEYDDYSHAREIPMKDGLLSMETGSAADSLQLQQKLDNLKHQALNLELSLQKMKSQYKDLSEIVHNDRKDGDRADFASEAAGGSVLDTPDTESYYEPWHQQATLFGIPIWKASYFTPRKVIQPWTQAGECWAFKGSRGKIVIDLAYTALIDQVTLEHIPVSVSLTGSIDSAPKDFVLYFEAFLGYSLARLEMPHLAGLIDRTFVILNSFTYDINGPFSQTFKLKGEQEEAKLYPVKTILIEIKSNWGHRYYTCIYRFKVHGKLADEGNYQGNYINGKNQ